MESEAKGQLVMQVLSAFLVAAVLSVCVVLPAEYGYDPLGAGRVLGLTELSGSPEQQATTPAVLAQQADELRQDELSFSLSPGQGLELKTKLAKGQVLVYEWQTDGGVVEVDFHGDTDQSPKGYISHRLDNKTNRGAGVLEAPFEGPHGWYWKNNSTESVEITLKASGFHSPFYMP